MEPLLSLGLANMLVLYIVLYCIVLYILYISIVLYYLILIILYYIPFLLELMAFPHSSILSGPHSCLDIQLKFYLFQAAFLNI